MRTFLIFSLLVCFASCGKDVVDPPTERRQDAITQNEYLDLLNKHRRSLGLNTLTYSYIIESEAYGHSIKMANGEISFGHNGWRDRCKRIEGELRGNACSEIVAKGQKTPAALFKSWYNSPSHRSSMEDPRYTHTGLGFVQDKEGIFYWTQLFLEVK